MAKKAAKKDKGPDFERELEKLEEVSRMATDRASQISRKFADVLRASLGEGDLSSSNT